MLKSRKDSSVISGTFIAPPAEPLINGDTVASDGLQIVLSFSHGLGERGRNISASFLLDYK